jgi:integrase
VTNNPFAGVAVEVPRKAETRETGKTFTDAEAAAILRAALAFPSVPRTKSGRIVFFDAARRWVPWLAAYTGARVGELTQLRMQDIEHRPCGYVLRITPEAGTVKTNKVRLIPLHPHLIELGLLDYVEAVKDQPGSIKATPLFNTGKASKGRGPAIYTNEKLATWVRTLASHCPSLADEDLQPNHGWRHTFKHRARRAGIEAGIRDAICGHAPRSSAERYEQHVPVEDMAEAMKRFPRYKIVRGAKLMAV